jgi:hypothetical protein
MRHIRKMEKLKQLPSTPKATRYRIAGVTRDGVAILKSPGRATHFTDKEIRNSIAIVLQELSTEKRGYSRAERRKS